jgi:hypothetical protein
MHVDLSERSMSIPANKNKETLSLREARII